MSLTDIFQKVRKEVPLDLSRGFYIDTPVIYDGRGNETGWNSGGRGVVFEQDGKVYRVKGVDPKSVLTDTLRDFEGNKINDVKTATTHNMDGHQVGTYTGHTVPKPFGVLTWNSVENLETVYSRLDEAYTAMKLTNPLVFLGTSPTGYGWNGWSETFQVKFALPERESDLRLREYEALVASRFMKMNADELLDKCEPIIKLYTEINKWLGFIDGAMLSKGLITGKKSRLGQNHVISKTGDGYGIFRVDHTSTEIRDPNAEGEFFEEVLMWTSGDTTLSNPDDELHKFNYLPKAVFTGSGHAAYETEDRLMKLMPPFARVYTYSQLKSMPLITTPMYQDSCRFFVADYLSGVTASGAILENLDIETKEVKPIPEKLFRDVLK